MLIVYCFFDNCHKKNAGHSEYSKNYPPHNFPPSYLNHLCRKVIPCNG